MEEKITGPQLFTPFLQDLQELTQQCLPDVNTEPLPALHRLQGLVSRLKREVLTQGFGSEETEIHFFKTVKPQFYSWIYYWQMRYRFELLMPPGDGPVKAGEIREQLRNCYQFYREHRGFYLYTRSGATAMDRWYFTRAALEHAQRPEEDPDFTTNGDPLVSRMLATDRLIPWLNRHLLQALAKDNGEAQPPLDNRMPWTATKAALIELIYALQSAGVFKNGQAGIKELAEYFSGLFGVELGNYYHVFNEIRLRKKNRTQLLDQMKEAVIRKMDALDERETK